MPPTYPSTYSARPSRSPHQTPHSPSKKWTLPRSCRTPSLASHHATSTSSASPPTSSPASSPSADASRPPTSPLLRHKPARPVPPSPLHRTEQPSLTIHRSQPAAPEHTP